MTVRRLMTLMLVGLLALLLAACAATPETGESAATAGGGAAVEKRLFVGPERVECVGVGPQMCYQVKETAEGEWEFFYSEIEGFDYEAGYQYELLVREEAVANPPADGSSLRWELLEVVSKEAVEASSDIDEAVGIYKGIFPAASSPGIDSTLYLNMDQTVRLMDDYLNDEAPVVEVGRWEREGDRVVMTLTGVEAGSSYDSPTIVTFDLEGDSLTTTSDDENYGSEGRRYLSFDALATGEQAVPYAAFGEQDGEVEGLYKGFAPAASCCGLDFTLLIGPEGSATLKSDYLNGDEPMVEQGSWTLSDGILSVALDGAESPLTFELSESPLTLISQQLSIFGEAPLILYRLEGIAVSMMESADE